MEYIFFFLITLILSALFTPIAQRLAIALRVFDLPNFRKIHKTPTPLLGGLSIYFSFASAVGIYCLWSNPDFNIIPQKTFLSFIIGGLILVFGGVLDDKYNLPAKVLWLFPALASLIAVAGGIGSSVHQLTNPFGSPISLDYSFSLASFHLSLASVFSWLWLMGMIFTTKFLDGLDGLCGGIAFIGGMTIFALSLLPHINQPITASLAIIFSASILGFLFYNFNPASIFLGESGSTFLGFALGVLSIILGGKIATALLVMGIPILDVAWAITRRLWYHRSPFSADRLHLHHRLLDIGFSQRQTVVILWGLAAFFGFTAVFLQTLGKLIALIILLCVMVFLAVSAVMVYKQKHPHIPDLFDKKP